MESEVAFLVESDAGLGDALALASGAVMISGRA